MTDPTRYTLPETADQLGASTRSVKRLAGIHTLGRTEPGRGGPLSFSAEDVERLREVRRAHEDHGRSLYLQFPHSLWAKLTALAGSRGVERGTALTQLLEEV